MLPEQTKKVVRQHTSHYKKFLPCPKLSPSALLFKAQSLHFPTALFQPCARLPKKYHLLYSHEAKKLHYLFLIPRRQQRITFDAGPQLFYSILFFPSSKPSNLASLFPRSCLVPTKEPTTGLCWTFDSVSWYDSTAQGRRLSLGQLTYPHD